jgi:hypothetical protein
VDRRAFIRHLGIGIAAGAVVPFIPSLIPNVISTSDSVIKFTGVRSGIFEAGDKISYDLWTGVVMDARGGVLTVKKLQDAFNLETRKGIY